jgi:hypothetical protein
MVSIIAPASCGWRFGFDFQIRLVRLKKFGGR